MGPSFRYGGLYVIDSVIASELIWTRKSKTT
jgi:hypothetical protein